MSPSTEGIEHRVYRVPGFLSSRPNWVPHPLTRKRVLSPPPLGPRGWHTRFRGESGGTQCRRRDRHGASSIAFKPKIRNMFYHKYFFWRKEGMIAMPHIYKLFRVNVRTCKQGAKTLLAKWYFIFGTSNTSPILAYGVQYIDDAFKGTQAWEFFWLRFWILYFFIVS